MNDWNGPKCARCVVALHQYIFTWGKAKSDYRLLPSFIASTRSVLNPMNCDVKSFGDSIVFAPHPTDWNSDRRKPANNNRFIQHDLDSDKYPVFRMKFLN